MRKKLVIKKKLRILIFLHGTSIMHKNAFGLSREEIIKQVKDDVDDSISDFTTYIPIGNVVKKLTTWQNQGAEILYLSSHKSLENVKNDEIILRKYNFPKGRIFFRKENDWNFPIEEARPDILIEDNCESIGGEHQMTYPNLKMELKSKFNSIVVKEFSGIDKLPDNVDELMRLNSSM
ncbi:MAG: hypothetical protein ACFFD5_04865 [Candidatus Thorarchaeota archaeon]